jgi:hypothetical protein
MSRIGDDESVIALNLTRDEFQQLIYAVAMFHHATSVAPRIAQNSTRSQAMKARRAADRFHARIMSLADGYGMDKG